MKRSGWWGWKNLAWVMAMVFLLLFVAIPLMASFLFSFADILPVSAKKYLGWLEHLLNYLMFAFAATWMFVVGSTFASFLNVVAWRVPRGRSILGASHCPYCNIQLTFRDNIPVWGWLKNGGRCSKCRLPISPRYVVVEIVLGAVFLVCSMTLLLSSGGIVPFISRMEGMSLNRMLLDFSPLLISILALHLVAIMGVFTFVLVEHERKQIPFSIFLVTSIILLAIVSSFPKAIVVPWDFPFVAAELPMERIKSLSSLITGAVSGILIGLALSRLLVRNSDSGIPGSPSCQIYLGLGVFGMIGGWQSVVIVSLIWFFWEQLSSSRPNDGDTQTISAILALPHARLLLLMLAHLASWRWFEFV